jgi:hypothetical protein
MRYYPVDVRGNLDEWGAIIAHQTEVHKRQQAEAHLNLRQNQANYKRDLDKAVN